MRSIKLKKEITDCNDNLMNNVMGENRFGPFYEAILAHFQKSIPEALQHLYDKHVDISERYSRFTMQAGKDYYNASKFM